ncbi:MAG: hypothetical protein Q4C89_07090 [Deinococcus sp.]|uniref:hypothetical protein n=1 Tax=Deinococcus sp. TaxID=47478 RepID=UPI0026DB060B|nr:hypothetical protein [Deinococcus sp.]MDO4245770.1 hypothetical protein [Deinococcus sp.]
MNKMPVLLALLLSASALAGGATDLATGQLWELTLMGKDGLSTRTTLHLTNPVPPAPEVRNAPEIQFYNVQDLFSGGWLTLTPSVGALDATLAGINQVQCFTLWKAETAVSEGYFLRGTADWNSQRFNLASKGTDLSRQQILTQLKTVSDGTCTLKRLR